MKIERERGWREHDSVVKAFLFCLRGLKSVVMIGEGNRIQERSGQSVHPNGGQNDRAANAHDAPLMSFTSTGGLILPSSGKLDEIHLGTIKQQFNNLSPFLHIINITAQHHF